MNNDNEIKINKETQKGYYPITLNLKDKLCVVIGCGNIGERKILSLLEYGAEIKVISKKISDKIKKIAGLADHSVKLKCFEKPFEEADLKGAFLVYCATGDSELNLRVFKAASAGGALINIVDIPELCNFIVPSVLKRGLLSIAISTSGAAPAFSKKLRHEFESLISDKYEEYIDFLAVKRLLIKDTVKDPEIRQKIFKALIGSNLLECFASGDFDTAENIFKQIYDKELKGIIE